YLEIEVIGPNRDLHSGSYGGVVANPAEVLAKMIASAKDDQGRILIPGFYDRVLPLSEEERAHIRAIPFDEKKFQQDLEVESLVGEEGFSVLERLWARPTLEVNGIWGGYTSQGSKTVLPAKAGAKISARLVPNQKPEEIYDHIEEFFRCQAPRAVKVNMIRHHGGAPVVIDIEQPYIKAAERALEEAFQSRVLYIREGGSIPIVQDFKDILGVETLLIGFALPDARAHSPNENIHIPTMWTGMESLVRLYYNLSQVQFHRRVS
ncbi:MAG: M20/M25/M40 family metallo-hydrolase, partial [bacterium]